MFLGYSSQTSDVSCVNLNSHTHVFGKIRLHMMNTILPTLFQIRIEDSPKPPPTKKHSPYVGTYRLPADIVASAMERGERARHAEYIQKVTHGNSA